VGMATFEAVGESRANRVSPGSRQGTFNQELRLVQSLFLIPGKACPKSVAFTGVDSRSGVSTLAVAAAINLAKHTTGRVCLVDGNLRRPSLHTRFGLSSLRGFVEAVLESGAIDQFVQSTEQRNLKVLTAGFHLSDPSLVLTSQRLKYRLAELCSEFDHVLLDVPSLGTHPDSVLLARLADGVVLVVEAGVTRRERAVKCKKMLDETGVKVLGAILNKRDFPIPDFVYRKL
jgi:protein-tyrosine kinase